MSISYTWKVTGIKTENRDNITDIVVQTYWQKLGVDGDGNTGTFSGATPFKVLDYSDIIPYDDLTEEIVLTWIKNSTSVYDEHINEYIIKEINSRVVPVVQTSLPWASN
jgi:hypothetical protein